MTVLSGELKLAKLLNSSAFGYHGGANTEVARDGFDFGRLLRKPSKSPYFCDFHYWYMLASAGCENS